jgi:hypothetical protein
MALAAVCPVISAWCPDLNDTSTWGFTPDVSAMPAQIAAATSLLKTVPVTTFTLNGAVRPQVSTIGPMAVL